MSTPLDTMFEHLHATMFIRDKAKMHTHPQSPNSEIEGGSKAIPKVIICSLL